MKLNTGQASSPGKGDGRWQQLNKTQVSVGIQYWMFFNSFLFNFFLILLFFLSCFSLGFSLFYSSFGLFFWGCVWCVGFPSAARNHLCYELWVSHHHASGFSFWFVLLLYIEVQITPGFLFSPHDMFVFQQDRDSYLNVMQRPRTLGILPEGLADIWVVPEWFCQFCGFRGKGREVFSSYISISSFLYSFLTLHGYKIWCSH